MFWKVKFRLPGAKNAALGILAAAVMTDEECIIENVPYVEDTKTLLRAIETIGAKVKYIDNHTVSICGGTIRTGEDVCVDDEYIRKIRASYYLLGALLGKYNYAQVGFRAAVILDCVRSTSISRALRHLVRK